MRNLDDEMESHRARRMRAMRRVAAGGSVCMLLGLVSLAVPPETTHEMVMLRVIAGFALLIGGFFLAVLPLLAQLMGEND